MAGIPAFLQFLSPVLIVWAGVETVYDRRPIASRENNDPDCFKCPKEIMEVRPDESDVKINANDNVYRCNCDFIIVQII